MVHLMAGWQTSLKKMERVAGEVERRGAKEDWMWDFVMGVGILAVVISVVVCAGG